MYQDDLQYSSAMTKAESLVPEAASDPVIRQIFDLVPEAKDEVDSRIKHKALECPNARSSHCLCIHDHLMSWPVLVVEVDMPVKGYS